MAMTAGKIQRRWLVIMFFAMVAAMECVSVIGTEVDVEADGAFKDEMEQRAEEKMLTANIKDPAELTKILKKKGLSYIVPPFQPAHVNDTEPIDWCWIGFTDDMNLEKYDGEDQKRVNENNKRKMVKFPCRPGENFGTKQSQFTGILALAVPNNACEDIGFKPELGIDPLTKKRSRPIVMAVRGGCPFAKKAEAAARAGAMAIVILDNQKDAELLRVKAAKDAVFETNTQFDWISGDGGHPIPVLSTKLYLNLVMSVGETPTRTFTMHVDFPDTWQEDEEESKWSQIYEADRDNSYALFKLAVHHGVRKQYNYSFSLFEKTLKLFKGRDKRSVKVYWNYGMFLVANPDATEEDYEKASSFLRGTKEYHSSLSDSFLSIDQIDWAHKAIDLAQAINVHDANLYFKKGKLFLAQGRNKEAMEYFLVARMKAERSGEDKVFKEAEAEILNLNMMGVGLPSNEDEEAEEAVEDDDETISSGRSK
jgi:tetratricopeptide (TPR) repeat protein